jgi:hypothetical protein
LLRRLEAAHERFEFRLRVLAIVARAQDLAMELLQLLERALLVEVERPELFAMVHLVLPFTITVTHRGRRGARPARREEREYREYLTDEQRRGAGCIGGRMPP